MKIGDRLRINPDSDKRQWDEDVILDSENKVFIISQIPIGEEHYGEFMILEEGSDDRKWHMDTDFLKEHFIPEKINLWEDVI